MEYQIHRFDDALAYFKEQDRKKEHSSSTCL